MLSADGKGLPRRPEGGTIQNHFPHIRGTGTVSVPEETMKKLKLDLEALYVESFEAATGPSDDGTVVAHLKETDPRVCPYTENWNCSKVIVCNETEYDTCGLSCDPEFC